MDVTAKSLDIRTRWRKRWQQWWMSRLPRQDQMLLTQRNVYILPTPAGLMLGLTLLVLLVASINFQLNLGFLLTFLLGGCAVVSIHVSHGTLRGLQLVLHPVEPHHAGQPTRLRVSLRSARTSARYGIGLRVLDAPGSDWTWFDVPAQGEAEVELHLPGLSRGRHALPPLTGETRFPLGIFRVWTIWRPAATVLVYPRPEAQAPALPPGSPTARGTRLATPQSSGEFDGVRPYRRGDPLRSVVWKKFAKADELVSRDSEQAQASELWLDATLARCSDPELRWSRLCAWVLRAEAAGLRYGLRLPGCTLGPDAGPAHLRACLEALALA